MAHTVFVLHGMGKHGANWIDPFKTALDGAYNLKDEDGKFRYPMLASPELGLDFTTRFNIVPIGYDDIFAGILARWKVDEADLGTDVNPNSEEPGFFTTLTQELNDAADSEEFFWTHGMDAVLYRLSPWVRAQVNTRVALQLAQGIHRVAGHSGNWSAIAHSLGTSVLHDSLNMLFTGVLPTGTPTGFRPDQAQAQAIIMVSNVSRLLQTRPHVLEADPNSPNVTTVLPGYGGQAGRGCRRYVTVRHSLDPFNWFQAFNPIVWPDAPTMAQGRYVPIRVEHIQQVNVHGFGHYIASPEVHVPIFRALDYDELITDDQAAKSLEDFEYYGTFTQADLVKIKQAWADLKDMSSIGKVWKAIKVLKEGFEEVQESLEQILDGGDGDDDDDNGDDNNNIG